MRDAAHVSTLPTRAKDIAPWLINMSVTAARAVFNADSTQDGGVSTVAKVTAGKERLGASVRTSRDRQPQKELDSASACTVTLIVALLAAVCA